MAFSFAGEQRYYVDVVQRALTDDGLSVFYDELEDAELWGADGIEEFSRRYGEESFRVVMFISADYVQKAWPTVERRAALGRLIADPHENHILPVRFDDTDVPGLDLQRIFKRADEVDPMELAELVLRHLVGCGRVSAELGSFVSEAKKQARLVGFTSMANVREDGVTEVSYTIQNRSESTIDSAVVVVPDYAAFPDASPDDQQGSAIEIVVGPVAPGQVSEDSFDVRLRAEPVFFELPYVAHLIWSDASDNHWGVCGSHLRRRWSRARTC